MTVRPDNRLLDAPLVPVVPHVRGSGAGAQEHWAQTTVQWNADATARCIQRRDAQQLAGHGRGIFLVCSDLRESIEDSARRGDVPILDEGLTGR